MHPHLPRWLRCARESATVRAHMPAIETHDLTKVYRTYKKAPGLWGAVKGLARREYEEVRAADGVSFSIEDGEFVGFLGPNGAGKTTVLKMLSFLLNLTSAARPKCSSSHRGNDTMP